MLHFLNYKAENENQKRHTNQLIKHVQFQTGDVWSSFRSITPSLLSGVTALWPVTGPTKVSHSQRMGCPWTLCTSMETGFSELGKSLWHNKEWLLLISFLLLDCDSDGILKGFPRTSHSFTIPLGHAYQKFSLCNPILGRADDKCWSPTPPGEILSPLMGNWKKEPCQAQLGKR